MSARIDDLLARMTWEQKLLQLQIVWRKDATGQHELARRGIGAQFWPPSAPSTNELQRVAVEESELGIPLLIALDVVHGQFTIFPTPLAQAASFDPDVARADARVSAAQARSNGVNWTFAPMVDVTRDARWGRVVEGFGEDALVGAVFARAKVEGYQGSDLANAGVASCLKHFVAYGAAEAGRDYNDYYTSKYLYLDLGPRFSFGAGSGYTSFSLSDLRVDGDVSVSDLAAGAKIRISVRVENTGARAGDDVVMLFIRDEVATIAQPVKRLRGFRRIALQPGAHTVVTFALDADDLRFWTDEGTRLLEPGGFAVWMEDGTSRIDGHLAVTAETSVGEVSAA